ncbi:MAG: retropepsin-like aspartic protease [Planctomycetota bacterium]
MDAPRSPVSPSWEVAAGKPALDHAHSPRSAEECSFREACPFAIGLFLVLVVTLTLLVTSLAWAGSAQAQTTGLDAVPIGGFQPWVAFTLTNEFSNENQDDLFFVADVDSTFNPSRAMPNAGSPLYEIGLLDSGSQVNLLTDSATTRFDLAGQGFTGTELIEAVGVSGSEFLTVQDPLGIFTAGLQHAAPGSGGTVTVADTTTLRGLKSNAPASAPAGSVLPNVIGLPMMTTHTTVIRNSQPQFIEQGDETFRAPAVEFLPLDAAIPADFSRRAALGLEVNATFGTTEPLYVFNVGNAINGEALHENPSTPTAVGGAFFTDIDIANEGTTRTAEVFFDTGAQVSVVNELLAAQLGFDVVNDEPDFIVPILGVGGAQSDIPGFIAESLTVPAVGGNFTATNVPIVVLENVPNPLGVGILDGILGTNVFWDRDLVIDPTGDRLWISDPVTTDVVWDGGADDYDNGLKWSVDRRPVVTDVVTIQGSATVDMDTDAQVYRMLVGGSAAATPSVLDVGVQRFEVFTDLQIAQNGTVQAFDGGVVSTQQINIGDGGTLTGAGTFIGDTITNAGSVRPLQGTEMTLVGTYQQEDTGSFEYLDVKVVVEGSASLAGTLDLAGATALPTPEAYGEAVVLLEADQVLGRFDTIDNLQFGDGFAWVVSYTADAVLATVALYGDANLNQQVEQGDLNAVLTNWGASGQQWATGDFSGDGVVDQVDLNAVLNNWGSTVAPSFAGFTVPEPAAALPLLGAAGLLKRRRSLARVA